ncbi:hypothetical protein OEK97_28825, partial [Escherichia coli]|uniref:hypothetical protein n=1 Tax=Escherichia coli TaxID=562 RepID=UPI0021DAA437
IMAGNAGSVPQTNKLYGPDPGGDVESSRQATIDSLIQQGVTNPTELLQYLNHNVDGKNAPKSGDFTLQEVQQRLSTS